ncbi:MAG: 3-deoxy-D-manno-octulosonic acid transferase [Rhodospirillaceae bacterium]|jgi:3-deoxy-D-manno-octulosonic-acid transferase|nr:3-deoxy-D-manno-octulosonic acid transferase [Rhodospirillaceae bacterium]
MVVALPLYRALITICTPLIKYYLNRRMINGKEDRLRLNERLGLSNLTRPSGRMIWLHAASIGESISMLPVIEHLQARDKITVLITTGTTTSASTMIDRLPIGAIHQYVPIDRLLWVRRFLDHWRPDLALLAESEFWPNLLIETATYGIPLILLNGRISDRSFARWQRHSQIIRYILNGFVLCLGQTLIDVERLIALGAKRALCYGNLKFAATPLPVDLVNLTELTSQLGSRPRWLAASTHPGEEMLIGRVHKALQIQYPELLTIIVPRHPNRGNKIVAELISQNFVVAQRCAGQLVTLQTQILLADTLGEMGLFIRLAPIVFIGKSLLGRGGQNPLEPALLGASILFGPHMDNFSEIAERMCNDSFAEQVVDETALTVAVSRRLSNPKLLIQHKEKSKNFAVAKSGILDAVLAEIDPWIEGNMLT